MILLWDVDSGLAQIDKYFHASDSHVNAGALLGVGIVNCGIKNDCDPVSLINYFSLHWRLYDLNCSLVLLFFPQALALLGEYIDKEDPFIRIGAIMGLGIAYAGAQNEQVKYLFSLCWWMFCDVFFYPLCKE